MYCIVLLLSAFSDSYWIQKNTLLDLLAQNVFKTLGLYSSEKEGQYILGVLKCKLFYLRITRMYGQLLEPEKGSGVLPMSRWSSSHHTMGTTPPPTLPQRRTLCGALKKISRRRLRGLDCPDLPQGELGRAAHLLRRCIQAVLVWLSVILPVEVNLV